MPWTVAVQLLFGAAFHLLQGETTPLCVRSAGKLLEMCVKMVEN
jgi:hypothetical protein